LSRKDFSATGLTALAVLALFVTHEGWNVWLSGHSHRRAAGAIFALGALTCGLGSPSKDAFTKLLAVLGTLALALLAVVTGSLPALSLLVGDIVLLWGLSTVRHAVHVPHQPRTA
jgi:hypothetical protein